MLRDLAPERAAVPSDDPPPPTGMVVAAAALRGAVVAIAGVSVGTLTEEADDLAAFERIIPCGIEDAGVSSLTREAGRTITVPEVLPHAEKHLIDVLG